MNGDDRNLTVHEEALIDQALERLLGNASVEDLSGQILAAWRQERGEGEEDPHPEDQPEDPQPRSRRRQPGRVRRPRRIEPPASPLKSRRLLAAAVVLLGVGLVLGTAWLTGLFGPPLVATSDQPVWVVKHPTDPGQRTTDIRAGDLVVVLPTETRRLTLPDDTRIDIASYTLFRFPPPAVQGPLPHLLTGNATVATATVPFAFSTGQGAIVRAELHSRVLAELTTSLTKQDPRTPPSTQPRDPDMLLQNARTLITTMTLPEAVLALTLLSGQAVAQDPDDLTGGRPGTKLKVNQKTILNARGDRIVAAPLTKAEKTVLDRSLQNIQYSTKLFDTNEQEALAKLKLADEAQGDMLSLSQQKPVAMFDYIRTRMLKIHAGAKEFDVRSRLLTVMVRDTDKRTNTVVVGELAKDRKKFDIDQLLVLSERNVAAASAELEQRIKTEPDNGMMFYPAAHLALKNNDVGRKFLEPQLDPGRNIIIWDQPLAAAAGLHRLGDKRAWPKLMARIQKELTQSVQNQQQKRVLWLLGRVEYFHRAVITRRIIPLPKRTNPVDAYTSKRKVDPGDMASVLKRLQELSRID